MQSFRRLMRALVDQYGNESAHGLHLKQKMSQLLYELVGAKDRREQVKLLYLYAGSGLSFVHRIGLFHY
jgi:hypothetical protein